MTDHHTPTEAQLLHLAGQARCGVALPEEHDALAVGITAMAAALTDVTEELAEALDHNDRTCEAVTRAEHAEAERDRYRLAWQSARHRAAMYLKSNRNLVASLDNGHAGRVAQSAARDAAAALTAQFTAEAAVEHVWAALAGTDRYDDMDIIRTALDQPQQPTTTEVTLPGDLRTCCEARIGHHPTCPTSLAQQPPTT